MVKISAYFWQMFGRTVRPNVRWIWPNRSGSAEPRFRPFGRSLLESQKLWLAWGSQFDDGTLLLGSIVSLVLSDTKSVVDLYYNNNKQLKIQVFNYIRIKMKILFQVLLLTFGAVMSQRPQHRPRFQRPHSRTSTCSSKKLIRKIQ